MSYYKNEFKKVSEKGEFPSTFQIKNNGNQTKWLNLNDESATDLINFLLDNYSIDWDKIVEEQL